MPSPRLHPLLVPLVAAAVLTPTGLPVRAQNAAAKKPMHLGRFTAVTRGSARIDFKNPKRPVVLLIGPTTLRSEGLDLDARRVQIELEGKVAREGELEGAVRIVVKGAPGMTDTLTTEKATYRASPDGKSGRITMPGAVRWVHVGPEVEEPAILNGSSGSVTLRDKGEGPLIELNDVDLNATPVDRKPEKKQ